VEEEAEKDLRSEKKGGSPECKVQHPQERKDVEQGIEDDVAEDVGEESPDDAYDDDKSYLLDNGGVRSEELRKVELAK